MTAKKKPAARKETAKKKSKKPAKGKKVREMFINFGSGKCPLCGDFGTEISREIFHCDKCMVAFNNFGLSRHSGMKQPEAKYWN